MGATSGAYTRPHAYTHVSVLPVLCRMQLAKSGCPDCPIPPLFLYSFY